MCYLRPNADMGYPFIFITPETAPLIKASSQQL
jgi:hypothetical protein